MIIAACQPYLAVCDKVTKALPGLNQITYPGLKCVHRAAAALGLHMA
jgi:hypothetical protein